MDKITRRSARRELAVLAPADTARSFEHVGDGLLFTMMMDAGRGAGLDDEDAAPQRSLNSVHNRNRSAPFGTRGLGCLPIEQSRLDDANRLISTHNDAKVGRELEY